MIISPPPSLYPPPHYCPLSPLYVCDLCQITPAQAQLQPKPHNHIRSKKGSVQSIYTVLSPYGFFAVGSSRIPSASNLLRASSRAHVCIL